MKGRLNLKKKYPENAIEFHDNIAVKWAAKYSSGIFNQRLETWKNIFLKYVKDDETWLDAGCGSGTLTKVIAENCVTVMAFDASNNMIKNFKQSLSQDQKNIFLQRGDLPDLSFLREQKFNGIVCSSVLEYLYDVEETLKKFHNHLDTKGKLLISIPNKGFNIRSIQLIIRRVALFFNLKTFNYLRYSIFCESKSTIIGILNSSGFDVIDVIPFVPNKDKVFYKYLAPSLYIYVAESKNEFD